jgi:hypothetical protein
MAYPATTMSSSYYRPRKQFSRVIKRQRPVLLLIGTVLVGGFLAIAVVWRNLHYERLVLDQGLHQAQIETLQKEIQQFTAQVEQTIPYTRLSEFARARGWLALSGHAADIRIPWETLTPAAKKEAVARGGRSHE